MYLSTKTPKINLKKLRHFNPKITTKIADGYHRNL